MEVDNARQVSSVVIGVFHPRRKHGQDLGIRPIGVVKPGASTKVTSQRPILQCVYSIPVVPGGQALSSFRETNIVYTLPRSQSMPYLHNLFGKLGYERGCLSPSQAEDCNGDFGLKLGLRQSWILRKISNLTRFSRFP